MLRGVFHFSFTVSDIEQSVEFYRDTMEFALVRTQEQSNEYTEKLVGYEQAHLKAALIAIPGTARGKISNHDLELIEYVNPRGERGDPGTHHPGAAHLAFAVDDIYERYEKLRDKGVEFVSPPNPITSGMNEGGATCYLRDPDTITLEMFQPSQKILDL